jgi:hypothetical protein
MLLTGLLTVLVGLLMGCSNDQDQDAEPKSELKLVSYTRISESSTVGEDFSPARLFLVGGQTTKDAKFVYRRNLEKPRWLSSLEDVMSGNSYAIYGYAPADAATATLSNESLSGATLTFSNLPAVSSEDICFVVGVQSYTEENTAKNIPLGQFAYTGGNFANLLMDHIYASVCFQMSLGAEYAQLRSIKIRKMELQTGHYSTATATIKLASNTIGNSPVQSAIYSDLSGTERGSVFFESTEGIELDAAELKEATCCFVPDLGNDLMVVTTYDVYDKKGNKVSERTVPNKVPNLNATRGQRVKLKLTVAPSYLYQLSDDDLNNPPIRVTN